MASATPLMDEWLDASFSSEGGSTNREWWRTQLAKVRDGDSKALFLSFGLIPRKLGKEELSLSDEELTRANQARSGWNPRHWSVDQLARLRLVLEYPMESPAEFFKVLEKLFNAGEVRELVALYQGLGFYPEPERYRGRAAEGIRTNMKAVFNAVAHDNPYPSEELDQGPWNQMVLKCLFIGSALYPVVGLDHRANADLSNMLVDYAQERWAASRVVNVELWRPVSAFAHEHGKAFRRAYDQGTPSEKQAVVKALSQHGGSAGQAFLAEQTGWSPPQSQADWPTLIAQQEAEHAS